MSFVLLESDKWSALYNKTFIEDKTKIAGIPSFTIVLPALCSDFLKQYIAPHRSIEN